MRLAASVLVLAALAAGCGGTEADPATVPVTVVNAGSPAVDTAIGRDRPLRVACGSAVVLDLVESHARDRLVVRDPVSGDRLLVVRAASLPRGAFVLVRDGAAWVQDGSSATAREGSCP